MSGLMTDIHQHLLWGLDDGAADRQIMQGMLQEAHRQGIGQVAATCHLCLGVKPFDHGLYRERLAEAQAYCAAENLPVTVLPGAEVAWTYQTIEALRQGSAPKLGDTDFVLLEMWRDVSFHEVRQAVRSLISAGYCPVLAHVERYRCLKWFPRQAMRLRQETGARFQVDAEALLNPQNFAERRFLHVLLKEHAMDAVATDAHDLGARPINLKAAHDWLVQHTDAAYARALTTFSGELR